MRATMQSVLKAAALAATAGIVAISPPVEAAPPASGFRPLAPGVLTVIPAPVAPPGAAAAATDTVSRADLLDITLGRADLEWTPLRSPAHTTFFGRGRDREYARDVWHLEFAFKPPRLIDVDVPAAGLTMQRKRIWYMLYRVKNAGGRRPKIDAADPARRTTEPFDTPIRFVPQFVLECPEGLDEDEGLSSYRAYLDRVIPAALEPIRAREKMGRQLLDSAAMVAAEIPPGEERWGVATWEDVDPRIDFFSIYVRGLTNAFQWRQRPGSRVVAAPPPGAAMEQALRTLRLDFWRPGDDRNELEDEISVGFAGMFERIAMGDRLLEAASIPGIDASSPLEGLAALGLDWSNLLEPEAEADPAAGDVGISLLPLQVVIGKIAAIPAPADRGPAVRRLFGDVGAAAFEDLIAAVAGPAEGDRDRQRRTELKKLGLTPEAVAKKPLVSLATIVRSLEAERSPAARRAAEVRLFGPAGTRIETLARQVALARTLAALAAIDIEAADIAADDALAAFNAVRVPVEAEADPANRKALLRGLFGARGPRLFDAAAAVHEGIDHAWVFRYENDVPGP